MPFLLLALALAPYVSGCAGPTDKATLELPGSPFKLGVSSDGCKLYAAKTNQSWQTSNVAAQL